MFTQRVAALEFLRLRTAWWERRRNLVIQRIHIHKFTFTTSFRVHAALHLVGFDKDIHWLNGMNSYDGWYEDRGNRSAFRRSDPPAPSARRYSFDYTKSSASWEPCADELFAFTRDILIPWFGRWTDKERLLKDAHSPLAQEQKTFLSRT